MEIFLKSAREAVDFYTRAFGAIERPRGDESAVEPPWTELSIGASTLVVVEWSRRRPRRAAGRRRTASLEFHLLVRNCNATTRNAWAAGARVLEPPFTTPRGDRAAKVRDPFGHLWRITSAPKWTLPGIFSARVSSYS